MKNYGYIEPVITPDQYNSADGRLGARVKLEVVFPDGHGWGNYLPTEEFQSRPWLETYGCTIYNSLNAIETILLQKYNTIQDFSERYIAAITNLAPPGADPQVSIEAMRRNGLISDALLPFDESITTSELFASPQPMRNDLLQIGKEFLDNYEFGHDWIPATTEGIKEYLKYSPICVDVYGWEKQGEFYIRPNGTTSNHWTYIYDFVEGQYWMVFDSYDSTHKKLAWDFRFGYAKRFHIRKYTEQEYQSRKEIDSLWFRILSLMTGWLQNISDSLKKKAEIPETPELPKPTPEALKEKIDYLALLADGIQIFEGWVTGKSRSWRNRNPGNLRSSKFEIGRDGGFAVFPDYETGRKALIYQLQTVCDGTSKAYNSIARTMKLKNCSELTLLEFTEIYAPASDNNNPGKYADFLATKIKFPTTVTMKELI